MKIANFEPEEDMFVKIVIAETNYHVEGTVKAVTDTTFTLVDRGYSFTFERNDNTHEIIEVRDKDLKVLYKYYSPDECGQIADLDERRKERRAYIAQLYEQGHEVISQNDIIETLEDIDIYNGICKQKRRNDV